MNERSEFNLSAIFDELFDSPVYYPIITWFGRDQTAKDFRSNVLIQKLFDSLPLS